MIKEVILFKKIFYGWLKYVEMVIFINYYLEYNFEGYFVSMFLS